MELFQLRYALMLSECCNFSRAAEKLFITQPTLSQQIQKLEKDIGFTLFMRDSRKVIPTPAGEHFLAYAAKVIREYEYLEKEVEKLQNTLHNNITFGASPISSQFFSASLPSFLSKFPQTEFKFTEIHDPELIEMVVDNKLDLAVVSLPRGHKDRKKLCVIPIREEYICAVLKKDHPLTEKGEVTLEELVNYQLIFSSNRGTLQKVMASAFEEHGLTPQESLDLTSIEVRLPYIMNGAISFSLSGRNEWSMCEDIIRMPVTPRIYSTLSIILPRGKQISPILQKLIEFLRQEVINYFGA